jgi:hypothetical protein
MKRFNTSKGSLSTEQLYDLSLNNLTTAIKNQKKVLNTTNNDDELSFLDESNNVNPEEQLRFDILKDVYLTKKSELDKARKAALDKENNEKILSLIYSKQEDELKSKSIEELQAMLR